MDSAGPSGGDLHWRFHCGAIARRFRLRETPLVCRHWKDDAKPFNPKHLTYEVFGPPGTVADISYFDDNGDPQFIHRVPLPWSLEFAVTGATGAGNVASQGDSDSIGCRILIDGVVKAEKITHDVHAFTFCMLKAA